MLQICNILTVAVPTETRYAGDIMPSGHQEFSRPWLRKGMKPMHYGIYVVQSQAGELLDDLRRGLAPRGSPLLGIPSRAELRAPPGAGAPAAWRGSPLQAVSMGPTELRGNILILKVGRLRTGRQGAAWLGENRATAHARQPGPSGMKNHVFTGRDPPEADDTHVLVTIRHAREGAPSKHEKRHFTELRFPSPSTGEGQGEGDPLTLILSRRGRGDRASGIFRARWSRPKLAAGLDMEPGGRTFFSPEIVSRDGARPGLSETSEIPGWTIAVYRQAEIGECPGLEDGEVRTPAEAEIETSVNVWHELLVHALPANLGQSRYLHECGGADRSIPPGMVVPEARERAIESEIRKNARHILIQR